MRRKTQTPADADMTPMLDIVFILLIFFVVTAEFLKERAMPMTPPPPDKTATVTDFPTILVNLSADGLTRVDGKLVDIEGVRGRIEQALAEKPEQAVLVQAAASTKNRFVIRAVDQAYSAGIKAVGFRIAEDPISS